MADKSGVTDQALPLPHGGGALEGIGEKFQADPYTGTGNFTVPIKLPPGRDDLTPALALSYSTGSPNGPWGLGWTVAVARIARRTSRGVPTYGLDDVFVLSGAEDLVCVGEVREPTAAGPRVRRTYRPRTEGQFARIVHVQGAGCDHWEVESLDGLRSWYGTDEQARIEHPQPRRTFAWLLSRTEDTFGNVIRYVYASDVGPGAVELEHDPHEYNQRYLSRVEYVNLDGQGSQASRFLYSVDFDYGELDENGDRGPGRRWALRPDAFSSFRSGFEIRTARRCRRILVRVHEPAEPARLVRAYELGYEQAPANGVSLLTSITVTGFVPVGAGDPREPARSDGSVVVGRHRALSLPPLRFGYTEFAGAHEIRDLSVVGGSLPLRGLDHRDFELIDLEGLGLPGIIEFARQANDADVPAPNATEARTHHYWANDGDARLRPREPRRGPPVSLSRPDVNFADMTGRGAADLLLTGSRVGYYETGDQDGWTDAAFRPFEGRAPFDLGDRRTQLVDIDGDGRVDVLDTGAGKLRVYLTGDRQWHRVEVERDGLDVALGDGGGAVRLADVSGDGPLDVVSVRNGRIEYWPHLGYGRFGKRRAFENAPRIDGHFDPARVLLVDVDGDGYADFVHLGSDRLTVCLNQAGNQFSDPITIPWPGRRLTRESVRGADMLGTGTEGLLWSETRHSATTNYRFLDLTANRKPYLLNRIDNSIGAETRIEYKASTDFHRQDRARGLPWRTRLPFPVQCVARTESIDQISGGRLVTTYRYHHGHWDGEEREFCGFARVDTLDEEDSAAGGTTPPLETRTWFHIGPVGRSRSSELDLSHEHWSGDPPMLERPERSRDLLGRLPVPALREALRTLRGRVLRTEVYAHDQSGRSDRPYAVTEAVHGVDALPIGGTWPARPEPWQERVFHPFEAASRKSVWERGHEPLTTLSVNGDHDAFGRVTLTIALGVPRGRDPRTAAARSEPYLVSVTRSQWARRTDSDHYLDRVARETQWEAVNDGRAPVRGLIAAIIAGDVPLRPLHVTVRRYDGDAFEGMPIGQLDEHGALMRVETLAFTRDDLERAWAGLGSGSLPPYFVPSDQRRWPDEYPATFQQAVPAQGGHVWRDTEDGVEVAGFYAVTERRRYGRRGLVTATRDALGHEIAITHDDYGLATTVQTDAVGLTTSARHDYAWQLPLEVTDANGNRTHYDYSPLGLLTGVTRLAAADPAAADAPGSPSVEYEYDFGAFAERREPIAVRTITHLQHTATSANGDVIERLEYSDGFGRLLQTRTQAEAELWDASLPLDAAAALGTATPRRLAGGPHVVVSGATVYDAKGRVIERFEPSFAGGWGYARGAAGSASVRTIRDPLGRAVRTVFPNGADELVVHGIPPDLAHPEIYEPTPWDACTYDAADNSPRSTARASAADPAHANTPASATIDALGRTVAVTERLGLDTSQWLTTRSEHDLAGHLRRVVDPLGRTAVRYEHDRAGRIIRSQGLDAGARVIVRDALGNPIEERDARGALVLRAYDRLGRPERAWARDDAGDPVTLRERTTYGDGGDPAQPGHARDSARAANRLGRIEDRYDEAGLVRYERYDFKGNAVERARQVISDDTVLSVFAGGAAVGWNVRPFRVNWEAMTGKPRLEPQRRVITAVFDALSRPVSLRLPASVDGARHELGLRYDAGGALCAVALDGVPQLAHAAFNARGQQVLRLLGNGLLTRNAYDGSTFRLARRRSELSVSAGGGALTGKGEPVQDTMLRYDLAGNVVAVDERAPRSGVAGTAEGPDRLLRQFSYDALYRLVSATGRGCSRSPLPGEWTETAVCGHDVFNHGATADNAPELTQPYAERYAYDAAGNLVRLANRRRDGSGGVRRFGIGGHGPDAWDSMWPAHLNAGEWQDPPTNRLTHALDDGVASHATHHYDAAGNLVRQGLATHFEWDQHSRLRAFRSQPPTGAEPSVHAHYLYDAAGNRVKKIVRHQGGTVDVTTYVDGLFEHRRFRDGTENVLLHVLDGGERIATHRIGPPDRKDRSPAVQYIVSDHLGSAAVTVDAGGALVNREEFTPFGETTFGGFGRKRFRFMGRERDEESGLSHLGARLYSPWLCRWITPDPAGIADGPHPYQYARNNPTTAVDTTGFATQQPEHVRQPELNGTWPYGKPVPNRDSLGQNVQKDHIIAQEKNAMMRTDPAGKNHYNPRADECVLQETGKATATSPAKPHTLKTFHDAQSDVSEIARLKDNGIGHITTDIVEPSRNAALRSGYKPESVDRALLSQLGNLHASQTPSETAKEAARWGSGSTTVTDETIDAAFADPSAEKAGGRLGTERAAADAVPSGGSLKTAAHVGGELLELGGKALGAAGTAADALQLAGGVNAIASGKVATGLTDVAEAGVSLGLDAAAGAAVKAGTATAGTAAMATLAAGGSVALAGETIRAALDGRETPLEVADKFYGTHFSDIHGWITGAYR